MAATVTPSSLSAPIQTTLTRLRQLNTQNIQAKWQLCRQDIETTSLPPHQPDGPTQWPTATLNDREHIAWERGLNVLWLYQAITVPSDFFGYPLTGLTLRLALTWWAEDAQIYVDGAPAQSGDLFECFTRLCLSDQVTPGQVFHVAIRLVSPGHDDGALVRSQLIYELPATNPTAEPSFVADEIEVLATLEPNSQEAIEHAITTLEWETLTRRPAQLQPETDALSLWQGLFHDPTTASHQAIPATVHPFQQSLSRFRRELKPFSQKIKARSIQCIGHAHLDMAWLWPIADTWEAAERTFKSVLSLQEDFPELTYTHSSPALFEWLEQNRPELFKKIQTKVAEGSWSIDAGLWIEPEFNIISGEAIARHILYGQRYCQAKFGTISKVAWLPDSFGFCWQLPQLLTQGGIETFATLKLSWNDTTEFPHQLFWWQSPDGSRILSLMLPPIGTDIAPVQMAKHAAKWESSTNLSDSIWLPGLGDHGGGPTRDMLEKQQRWEKSPFFPTLSFTTPDTYIKELPLSHQNSLGTEQHRSSLRNQTDPTKQTHLPTWNNELYLELHRGCYTTHADQKKSNRQCEDLLYQAEVFASIAQLTVDQPYPKSDIDTAWKALLFNQFHDILPGTSIPEVFVEANQHWQQVQKIGQRVLHESLSAISKSIPFSQPPHPEATPIIVFNSLSWPCTATVSIQQPKADNNTWLICDTQQQNVPSQITSPGQDSQPNILFSATNIPAVGYKCFWIYPEAKQTISLEPPASPYTLENRFIRATIDPQNGLLISLIEKSTQTESIRNHANQLQAFRDESGYWDAWNIASDYTQHPLPSPKLCSIQLVETGPIRQRIRVDYRFNQSTIRQDYVLDHNSPTLKVENLINWQETKTLLKVNFPTTTSANQATYEIPFGAITRTTNPQTTAEKAQWEVAALRWADIGNSTFGVSILTSAKHGFDTGPNHIRLTLLKSPIWPDPSSDRGIHQFTYAIYPHPNNWQTARTAQIARELNIPPIIHHPSSVSSKSINYSEQQSFLQIHNPNLILSAFKLAEERDQEFVLRCYETHGATTKIKTTNTLPITGLSENKATSINILEQPVETRSSSIIQPWKIVSYRIQKQ